MIDRYTIKFGPAVSQKELEKALQEDLEIPSHTNFNKIKARIELIGEFSDIKQVSDFVKKLAKKL